jgi:hypothetical protein
VMLRAAGEQSFAASSCSLLTLAAQNDAYEYVTRPACATQAVQGRLRAI